MNQFRIECCEVNYFTIIVEAETEDEARELAHADINSFDIEDEYTSEWDITIVEEIYFRLPTSSETVTQRPHSLRVGSIIMV